MPFREVTLEESCLTQSYIQLPRKSGFKRKAWFNLQVLRWSTPSQFLSKVMLQLAVSLRGYDRTRLGCLTWAERVFSTQGTQQIAEAGCRFSFPPLHWIFCQKGVLNLKPAQMLVFPWCPLKTARKGSSQEAHQHQWLEQCFGSHETLPGERGWIPAGGP